MSERSDALSPQVPRGEDDSFAFDVFLSHAREDKPAVRAFTQRLTTAGLRVWLDEEQLPAGAKPREAIVEGLRQSRHVLAWVTEAWLRKEWTQWEPELFLSARNDGQRFVPVLHVPHDKADLGPYVTRQTDVPHDVDDDQRLWLAWCGVHGHPPGSRATWVDRGRELSSGHALRGVEAVHPPAPGTIAARLEAAYERLEELTTTGEDTAEATVQVLALRREQRHGPSLHAGEFLGNGRFRLIEVVGRGGFATVWKAYDRRVHSLVAMKVLHGQFTQDGSRRERLFRGARRMAQLRHPNVVEVIEPLGEQDGFHYYVMEYVAGGDLYRAVLTGMTTERTLAVVDEIAGALEAAHRQGLVHRDVKPQNILLRKDGTAALTDFDLVTAKDTTGGTRTGALGTVLYAAPEQNENAATVDHRADVYSLGMTAVFCLHGAALPMKAMRQLDAFLGGLSCSASLRRVLRRAVALEPGERYPTMRDLRADLRRVRCSSEELLLRRPLDAVRELAESDRDTGTASPQSDALTEFEPVTPSASAKVSRRRVLAGCGAAVTMAMAAWILDKQNNDPAPGDNATPGDDGEVTTKKKVVADGKDKTDDGKDDLAKPKQKTVEPDKEIVVAPRGGVELVRIPGGEFLMGSAADEEDGYDDERPQHEVTLANFYLARTPVTNAQYRVFLEANPAAPKPWYWDDSEYNQDEQPVVGISWHDATAYCEWAGLKLPTEAQWEYACRGGTTTRYHSGETEADLRRVGWYDGNSDYRLHAVGELEPNDFGLYDMHGNAWEWCADAFESYTTSPRAGDGLRKPFGAASRVLRGGSFGLTAVIARSAYRSRSRPDGRDLIVGFRPAQGHPFQP
ncbi:MAG: SUMF1/EgtB/PvdO family nonheme iron enzyme [Deltaproteobacteria bacterium]|nr:SUMF1/EgtB/PvdO family nonheme iron enzyme [Deltaproteobacteria bacterium]